MTSLRSSSCPSILLLYKMGDSDTPDNQAIVHVEASLDVDRAQKFDPYNWPRWVKWVATVNAVSFAFMGTFNSGVSSMLPQIITGLGISSTQASTISTYSVLGIGLGNFIWVPVSKYIGKRYAIVTSALLFFACMIWSAVTTSYDSLVGARILGGIAGSAVEALGPAVISEMFYEHELANAMSVYTFFLAVGTCIAKISAGYFAAAAGYRWYFGLCAILGGINLVTLVLFFPETSFTRHMGIGTTAADLEEAKLHDAESPEELTVVMDPRVHTNANYFWSNVYFLRQHPHIKRDGQSHFRIWFRPLICILEPPILLSSFLYGAALANVVALPIVISLVFPKPPYNFAAGAIGLFGIPSIIGVAYGAVTGGYCTDYISNRIHARRKTHRPEDRLWGLLFTAILSPFGVILFGIAISNSYHWIVSAIARSSILYWSFWYSERADCVLL